MEVLDHTQYYHYAEPHAKILELVKTELRYYTTIDWGNNCVHSYGFFHYEFERKFKKKEYVQLTKEHIKFGAILIEKKTGNKYISIATDKVVFLFRENGTDWAWSPCGYGNLLRDYTFEDGSICGKLK